MNIGQPYRTAKAVELLVEVRRRTENLVPAAYAKRSLVQWKADEKELAAARARYHKARSRWRVAKVRCGDARETFFVANIARSSDCCVAWVVCGFRFWCGARLGGADCNVFRV